jgi:hypothetical protein
LNIIYIIPSFASIFDSVNWEYEKESRTVKLYKQKNIDTNLNFYKAEIKIDDLNFEELVTNISSFNEYTKIFSRTNFFKVIKKVDETTYIVNAELNFFPYKNRNYYIECRLLKTKTKDNKNKFVIEWSPVDQIKYANLIQPSENNKRITTTYGRWSIVELTNNKQYISVEYYNDWETNLPLSFVYAAEKSSIMNNVFRLIKYSNKKK